MGSSKCQTTTATPAEPGELPYCLALHLRWLIHVNPAETRVSAEARVVVVQHYCLAGQLGCEQLRIDYFALGRSGIEAKLSRIGTAPVTGA